MSDIVKFSPAAGGVGFAQGAADFGKNRPVASGGVSLLLLQKADGRWVYGVDRIEVEDDSQWCIDANSVCKGYVAWHAGQPTERMSFVGQPDVDPSDLPHTAAKMGWEEQVGFGLICLTGEDEGERAMYKTNTMGGKEVWNRIFDEMAARAGQGLPYNPIVKLESSSYQHREHGTIHKPVIDIVGWMGEDGAPQIEGADDADASADDAVADAEAAPQPRNRRGRGQRRAT